MNRDAFSRLCYLLEYSGGLTDKRFVTVPEQVAIFLFVLAHHKKNRVVKFDFIRSNHTVNIYFNNVLAALLKLHSVLLVAPKPIDDNCIDSKWKLFNGCLGILDGTYIKVRVPTSKKGRYRTRKGDIVVNVMGVRDKSMKFIYVLTGWEGSAADSRIFRDALNRPNGLRVPIGTTIYVTMGTPMGWVFDPISRVFGLCEMEYEGMSSQRRRGAPKEKGCTRTTWTQREEEVLINGLKHIINTGWKYDNGFRPGFLAQLENYMLKHFPFCDLKVDPHIQFKLHV
ncbi:UNVERIFIED_CONTAM: hypothetical protein Sradi_1730500 [Sesamum radiatum]|uniref:DDE Tnp4 domain-containing protein n=1 Tax=Sesamum radiatum TaxID=300843 RepID=A0AAW2TSN3_SESRA